MRMKRSVPFEEEHEIFRKSLRRFLENEFVPHLEEWCDAGAMPREFWQKLGEQGYLCPWVAEEYGGMDADFLFSVILAEEIARYLGDSAVGVPLHSDMVMPYIDSYGTPEQKARWMRGAVSGEKISAVAMTEPGAGSDLAAIRATAKKEGDGYVINGQKTFITNGTQADLVVVAVKTDTAVSPHQGMSLFVVERGTPGFTASEKLEKIGIPFQDTAELYFEECRVPVENLLGEEGRGFYYLMEKLQQERLVVSMSAQVRAEVILATTIEYCKSRELFGKPLSSMQNTQFRVAEMATEIELGRTMIDRLIVEHVKGEEVVKEVSMAKWWVTEMLNRVATQCLQLHGGYGYMVEYPVARAWVDARVQTLYAGTTEVMKTIIAKRMGL
jgi:acyl-CoA dehydrogenase